MLFSERYGYKKAEMLKKDEMPEAILDCLILDWLIADLQICTLFDFRLKD
jgi:hypothetical protein